MRPKDLKSPFRWDERTPLIVDNVLFVPDYYSAHDGFVLPSWQQIFENNHPIHIEYCSGNGEWIINQALENPHINWISVEMQFPRVRKIWSKSQNMGVKNLFIICGEALTFTQKYIKQPCFQAYYVNFPDPWPKKRHAKHRIIQEPFATELARCALPEATACFVTDDSTYAAQMQSIMHLHPQWGQPVHTVLEGCSGSSYFERLWLSKGKQINQIFTELAVN